MAGRKGAAATAAAIMKGFSAGLRQATKVSVPSGRTPRRMLAKAASGSSKNITPNREMTASNAPGSRR